jgi:hypothetical protein
MSQEQVIVAVVALPFVVYALLVWVASEAERRAFKRFVDRFDEVTRDHRVKTPRVRMTLYQKLVDKTIRRRERNKAPAPDPEKPPPSESQALRRRHVFLNLRPPVERSDDTQRMSLSEQITLRMRH